MARGMRDGYRRWGGGVVVRHIDSYYQHHYRQLGFRLCLVDVQQVRIDANHAAGVCDGPVSDVVSELETGGGMRYLVSYML